MVAARDRHQPQRLLFVLIGLLVRWHQSALKPRTELSSSTSVTTRSKPACKKGKLILLGPDGEVRYTLTPTDRNKKIAVGLYKIHVEGADGLVLDTPEFTIKERGAEVKVPRPRWTNELWSKTLHLSLARWTSTAERRNGCCRLVVTW